MTCLVGTDEAGYGPNLGPLVITATVWRVPGDAGTDDLYELLAGAVSRQPPPSHDSSVVCIADSKTLYQSGGGYAGLERGVFAALALLGHCPTRWREIWRRLVPDNREPLETEPWFVDFDRPLPLALAADQLDAACRALPSRLAEAGVELRSVRAVAAFPAQFNTGVHELGNKATLLSRLTLDLLAQELQAVGDEPILVQCDKHGGRNKYGAQLQQAFPDYLVEVLEEGRARSVYRWGPPARRAEFRFCVQGEQFLPCALASMVSKYLRELALLAFNEFWRRHLPHLKPTAGYPVDARRFHAEIAECQARLGIPDHLLWRDR